MRAAELFKLIEAVRKPAPLPSGGSLRIAIVGSGYAGLACAYFGCNVADTVKIFGLEDSPGVQRGSSASTISVNHCSASYSIYSEVDSLSPLDSLSPDIDDSFKR